MLQNVYSLQPLEERLGSKLIDREELEQKLHGKFSFVRGFVFEYPEHAWVEMVIEKNDGQRLKVAQVYKEGFKIVQNFSMLGRKQGQRQLKYIYNDVLDRNESDRFAELLVRGLEEGKISQEEFSKYYRDLGAGSYLRHVASNFSIPPVSSLLIYLSKREQKKARKRLLRSKYYEEIKPKQVVTASQAVNY